MSNPLKRKFDDDYDDDDDNVSLKQTECQGRHLLILSDRCPIHLSGRVRRTPGRALVRLVNTRVPPATRHFRHGRAYDNTG